MQDRHSCLSGMGTPFASSTLSIVLVSVYGQRDHRSMKLDQYEDPLGHEHLSAKMFGVGSRHNDTKRPVVPAVTQSNCLRRLDDDISPSTLLKLPSFNNVDRYHGLSGQGQANAVSAFVRSEPYEGKK